MQFKETKGFNVIEMRCNFFLICEQFILLASHFLTFMVILIYVAQCIT